jgi:hypothetical protein
MFDKKAICRLCRRQRKNESIMRPSCRRDGEHKRSGQRNPGEMRRRCEEDVESVAFSVEAVRKVGAAPKSESDCQTAGIVTAVEYRTLY